MAVLTSARAGVALGVGQPRATNISNVGLDRGMMKGFGERLLHTQHRRLSTAGALCGSKRPYLFLNPLADQPTVRPNRRGSISRLRKLEKRALWWTGFIASIAATLRSLQRFNLFRSYNDQVRCCVR